jgi:hypothetical protein
VHLPVKSRGIESNKLNCDKCSNNCILTEDLLACRIFEFLKTHKSVCTLYATLFTSMTTGYNRVSVTEKHSSSVPCKTAATLTLDNNQLDVQICIYLLQSCTC